MSRRRDRRLAFGRDVESHSTFCFAPTPANYFHIPIANFEISMSVNYKLWLSVIGFITFFQINKATASPQASFDCGKAKSKIEKLICSDEELAAQDRQLAAATTEVKAKYTGEWAQQFLKGQRTWLKLRDEACFVNENRSSTELKIECLNGVYGERLKELREQSGIANLQLRPSGSGIDAVLDEPRKLAAYYPEEMSALYSTAGHNIDCKTARLPRTCRELSTLTAGNWGYSGDTIGDQSSKVALGTCQAALLSASTFPSNPSEGPKINFSDLMSLSNEFICLDGCSNHYKLYKERPKSLEDLRRERVVVMEQDASDTSTQDSSDQEQPPVLSVSKDEFQILETHYRIWNMVVGNFTNQGRQEALLNITIWPNLGTYRATMLILAYYDKTSHSIRPELLEKDSLFVAKSKPLPSDYFQED